MLTDRCRHEVDIYGQALSGDESELILARYARCAYLKKKIRPPLEAMIGDYGDNITDTTKALVLASAIALGIVTDPKVVDTFALYVKTMLDAYGGPESILPVLQRGSEGLRLHVVDRYYAAKAAIAAAETVKDVNAVDVNEEGIRDL
jgi:hypothetical protein